MYEQRAVPSEDSFSVRADAVWTPLGLPLSPESSDRYVVVDERLYGRLTLAVAPWPTVDRAGRLHFQPSSAVGVEEEALQRAARESRQGLQEEAADRPIRIGDVFLVRELEGNDPSKWGSIFDVSAQAREAAKTALHSAVAPVATESDELVISDEEEPPDVQGPRGPVAGPSV